MLNRLAAASAFLGLAIGLSTAASARGDECRIEEPETIDPGYMQQLSLVCDEAFVGLIQVSLSEDFSSSASLGIRASRREDGEEKVTVEFRVPWDIADSLDELFVRGFALPASGSLTETEVLNLQVGQGPRVYESIEPDKGLFVVQMEAEQDIEDWRERTYHDGYTGLGYLQWQGDNHYDDKTHGRIDYRFKVEHPGTYQLSIRSFHYGGHLRNDVWMKVDSQGWKKVYSATDGSWNWQTDLEGGIKYRFDLGRGVHVLKMAARSERFAMDRFHLFRTSDYSRSEIEDETLPESGHYYQR